MKSLKNNCVHSKKHKCNHSIFFQKVAFIATIIIFLCTSSIAAIFKTDISNKADKKIVELTYPDSWKIKDGSKPYEIKQLISSDGLSMCFIEVIELNEIFENDKWDDFFNALEDNKPPIFFRIMSNQGIDNIESYERINYNTYMGLRVVHYGKILVKSATGFGKQMLNMFGYKNILFGIRCLSVGKSQQAADKRFEHEFPTFIEITKSLKLK